MILSYHPCFKADKNILCAGREPDTGDLSAIKAAAAVILPQGCYKSLYKMAKMNCRYIFPDFAARFKYEGKIGQIRLFEETGVTHPKTEIYDNINAYYGHYGDLYPKPGMGFPLVFKFNWGGEGTHVYLIKSSSELFNALKMAETFERSGRTGFIIQEYIPSENRSLRVVVVGKTSFSYWRVQQNNTAFCASLAKGAIIDTNSDPALMEKAVRSVKDFCSLTGINLAGFDLLFSTDAKTASPLFLEINYYFGRRGLGGSEVFYDLLETEINQWIESLGLH
ncbi:MAG: ATP-grasp domain-containing protein [Desulfobacterales bacterium]|nr:MAG: ATP-grasp domain-containing protein [Desulfobacterales bacterium]